ncbi:nucleotide exchange factor GrpE [Mycoplasmopsis citelli]|uniref:nucleotide exchange factor GrpE n=1 Tax=Mycoplasmopsis citelli TaxID=171281 RepID=UPI002114383D|nr:nucleotide exchange factor GrpE [Mycoplasmopsis citelli]UUD36382.1 nucleotide exchange factor GrpE [Mycoplasmopsis citelli]
MNKIKKGDVLNGKFTFKDLGGNKIEKLSGFKSIVIGENDLQSNLDDFLIGKKYKRNYHFEITLDEQHKNQDLAGIKVSVEINEAQISPKVVVKEDLNQKLEQLKKENEDLKKQVEALTATLKTSEYVFKDKMIQAAQKAKETIEEKTAELSEKFNKEKLEIKKYALQKFIEEFAIPYNNLILAVKSGQNSANDQVQNYCYGFSLVLKQLEDALNISGIKIIEPQVGSLFDAHEQEVIDFDTDPQKQHEEITSVVRLGFKLGERAVVPAQVKINKNL